jgi:hypothetical protein
VNRTLSARSFLHKSGDVPAGRELEQALDTCDAHLLPVHKMPQALEPLDIPRTVIPLATPPGRLDQALRFVQAKGLFRDPEEIGDHPDGKAGPRIDMGLG